jgi:hypothetical protein
MEDVKPLTRRSSAALTTLLMLRETLTGEAEALVLGALSAPLRVRA